MQRLKTFTLTYTFNSLIALVIAAFLTACGGGGLGLNPDPAVKLSLIHISEPTRPY